MGFSRSVRTAAAAAEVVVVVTNGTQHALDLISRVLLRPGDVAAVEEPGYPPARRLFTAMGVQVAGVRVDAEGLVVADLPDRARLVYVTPSHQFPLGRTMSLARRQELLAWAGTRPVAIVEDDYDSEFRFSARPLEPLCTLDRAGRDYADRHARVTAALTAIPGLDVIPTAAGLHMTALLPVSSRRVVAAARRQGVGVEELAAYTGEESAVDGLVVGFGAVDPDRIEEGLAVLARLTA
ncbi:aminotransferase-like domain-containing protein [Actinoplanes derwentensis]|uniref:aminotransferase-like domain-containing protein n=1 Tax=Actinoplanes derwentensis TaxID=113562 RepID=UPI001E295B16|nr:PLP-dependent aminotransferase family protein [Actinoplanes derwentensis]